MPAQPLLPASVVMLSGRVLFLCCDPQRVAAQLAGAVFNRAEEAGALREDISTDEISPLPAMVHFDAKLGRYAHTGFTAGGQRPIGVGALQTAGVQVLVGGARYGKGSSREHRMLDRLAVAKLSECTFKPGADENGKPIGGSFDVEYVWKLE